MNRLTLPVPTEPIAAPIAAHFCPISRCWLVARGGLVLLVLAVLLGGCAWREDYDRALADLQQARTSGAETGRKLDKDVFRRDLGSLTDAYTEVARRLGVLPSNVTHASKPTLIN